MEKLFSIRINGYNQEDKIDSFIELSYQLFGQPLGGAPIILVNHALTGNSNVAGENGWWKTLIGEHKVIDTKIFSVICFNIPGNGFEGTKENLIENYKAYTTRDIANFFWEALDKIGVKELFAIIGGSLGGGIAWEMGFLRPKAIQNLIPIASNYKANDWLIANVLVQDQILNNSLHPIHDARMHAMLLYRTAQSLKFKFNSEQQNDLYNVESWLLHHGKKLEDRFTLSAYKLMNHLLKTIGQDYTEKDLIDFVNRTTSKIHQIAINSDYFFIADDNKEVHRKLKKIKDNIFYSEINSIHGHDAFLIEYEQLNRLLKPIFNNTTQTIEV